MPNPPPLRKTFDVGLTSLLCSINSHYADEAANSQTVFVFPSVFLRFLILPRNVNKYRYLA
jgi:hypothetical protein